MNTFAGISAGGALTPSPIAPSRPAVVIQPLEMKPAEATHHGLLELILWPRFWDSERNGRRQTPSSDSTPVSTRHRATSMRSLASDAGQHNIAGSGNTALGFFTDVGNNLTNATPPLRR